MAFCMLKWIHDRLDICTTAEPRVQETQAAEQKISKVATRVYSQDYLLRHFAATCNTERGLEDATVGDRTRKATRTVR